MINKKGLSSIVVTLSLLMVSIMAFTIVQSWYDNYSSSLLANNYPKDISYLLAVQGIRDDKLYVMNKFQENFTIDIIKINNEICKQDLSLDKGINFINITDCTIGLENSIVAVTLITNNGIIHMNAYVSFANIIPSF